MLDLVHRGLRIQLESANLSPDRNNLRWTSCPACPRRTYDKQGDTYVLTPLDSDQGDIAGSATALIARVQAIPFEQIGDNLNKTLAGANGIINDPKLRQAVASLNRDAEPRRRP